MCIVVVYDIKDSVTLESTYKHWKNEKCKWLHPNYGIRVSYFQWGKGKTKEEFDNWSLVLTFYRDVPTYFLTFGGT